MYSSGADYRLSVAAEIIFFSAMLALVVRVYRLVRSGEFITHKDKELFLYNRMVSEPPLLDPEVTRILSEIRVDLEKSGIDTFRKFNDGLDEK
jgi:hypothetical protein